MSLLYQSKAMLHVIEQAKRYARSSATVLIEGESGTGKELIARLIHDTSERKPEPLVRVNCTSLSDGLFESELFGHERGAFTGAVVERQGRIDAAGRGTLFLDEVGELSLRLQPKLLRVLEEAEFERVGSQQCRPMQARVVAATNRSLSEDVAKCKFRLDLYHRLNVLPLTLPALRERREDIPLLAQHFVVCFRKESGIPVKGLAPQTMRLLSEYHWPGNVRQLRNVIHRACVLATDELVRVDESSLHAELGCNDFSLPSALDVLPLRDIERHVILNRIEAHGGNKSAAARALGVTSRTLRNKLVEYRRLGDVG
ncbi:MAG: sigma 54-interacting transcriptional regulator [Planctomycetaceae bacterium]|nr:sigma 54-interacting transcriptional regulator [Planctomycetaceae bacterium]